MGQCTVSSIDSKQHCFKRIRQKGEKKIAHKRKWGENEGLQLPAMI